MLADVSGEEVEAYMLSNSLVSATDQAAAAPTDRGCSDEEHEAMQKQSKPIRFF